MYIAGARPERLSVPSGKRRDETFQFAYSIAAISFLMRTAAAGFGGPGRAVLMAKPRIARSLADRSGNQTWNSATAPTHRVTPRRQRVRRSVRRGRREAAVLGNSHRTHANRPASYGTMPKMRRGYRYW
jgi:hypothetical protein